MGRKFLKYFGFIGFIFLLAFVILSGNNKTVVMTSNINSVKSLQAVHIVNKYNSIKEAEKKVEIPFFESFYDLRLADRGGTEKESWKYQDFLLRICLS